MNARRDWPNIWRLIAALWVLLLSPLAGILIGALYLGSMERGWLIATLLGLAGFALITWRYWQGEKGRRRRLSLLVSAASVTASTLLSVFFDHVIAAYALYFAVSCECFSLIPWFVRVGQEIQRGEWRDWAPPSRREEFPQKPSGPELAPPAFPWWLILPVVLAGAVTAAGVLWQSGTLVELRYPSPGQVEEALEERYGEPFMVRELFYVDEDLRTWAVSPEADPSLVFTVATGPAAEEDASGPLLWGVVGRDNYRQHAWNARVVPVLQRYGMEALYLTITPEQEQWGVGGQMQFPEPFASEFHYDSGETTMVGWYILPAAYWAGEEEHWEAASQRIAELLEDLRDIAPFAYLGCYRNKADDNLVVLSWYDWILPVAVNGGFVGLPIPRGFTAREILAVLETAHPRQYYYVEDGLVCRAPNFDPATPFPVPDYGDT